MEIKHYNDVYLAGTLKSKFTFHHKNENKSFFSSEIEVERLSGVKDLITILLPEDMVPPKGGMPGSYIEVYGSMRSYNRITDGKKRMILSVFAKDIQCLKNRTVSPVENNRISLCGEIIKPPLFRTTPGGSKITELALAVSRPSGKSDYLPCIVWGDMAKDAANLKERYNIEVTGRIQSRDYTKKLNEEGTKTKKMTVNEISVGRIQSVHENC